MTPDRKRRLIDLIPNSCEDNHLIRKLLLKNIKLEFTEFKKVSLVWVTNNFGSLESLVNEYNSLTGSNIQYSSYFRSTKNKDKISQAISGREWYNDGERNYHLNPEIDEIPKHYIKGMLRGK
jgi:hypothetical protein